MRILTVLLLTLAAALVRADGPPAAPYDAALAVRLGADERGMKMYSLVMLSTGPRTDMPKADADKAFAEHLANMGRLAAAGKLVFAGPLAKNARYRGLFVFDVKTSAEARALLATDPAIKAGLLVGEVYGLYGSAALLEVNRIHATISRE